MRWRLRDYGGAQPPVVHLPEPVSSPARVTYAMKTRAQRRHERQRKVEKAKRAIRQQHSIFKPAGETEAQMHVRASKWADNMDVHGKHCLCKMEKHLQIPTISEQRRRDALDASR